MADGTATRNNSVNATLSLTDAENKDLRQILQDAQANTAYSAEKQLVAQQVRAILNV